MRWKFDRLGGVTGSAVKHVIVIASTIANKEADLTRYFVLVEDFKKIVLLLFTTLTAEGGVAEWLTATGSLRIRLGTCFEGRGFDSHSHPCNRGY